MNKVLMILVLSLAPYSVLAQPSPPNACEPGEIDVRIVNNDLNGALNVSRACVAHFKATVTKSPKEALTGYEWLDLLSWAYHLCAQAQVQAMMGDRAGADASIKAAEDVYRDWRPWFDSPVVDWASVIDATKGFVLEKSGNIDAAKRWYLEHRSEYATGRLAVLALSDPNNDDAIRYARGLLAVGAKNPTAHVVMGAVLESRGQKAEALTEYQTAVHQMTKAELQNEFLPIAVAESARAKSAIARLTAEVK